MADDIRRVTILAFDGVERLDIEGPLGVFGWVPAAAGRPLDVRLASPGGGPVRDHLVKKVIAVDGPPGDDPPDLLVVPGGPVDGFINNAALLAEVRRLGGGAGMIASVCTGTFLLAKAGLIDGREVVTHHMARDRFRAEYPAVTLLTDRRYHRDGRVWSSAGISAGIDLSLKIVLDMWGLTAALKVRDFLEYFPDPPFPG